MACIVDGLRMFGPLGLACLALIAASPPAVRAQIVGPGVYAWGINSSGQLGNGTTTNSSTPAPVTGLPGVNVTAVAGGSGHSVAVTSTGAVYAWGSNAYGQLGTGNTTQQDTPVPVTGLSGVNVTAVAAGLSNSLALTSTGAVYAWGYNGQGELGNGTTTNSSTPIHVTGGGLSGVTVTAVAPGGGQILAVTNTGAVYAWGYNNKGQLGNGTTTDSPTPVPVTGLSGVNVTAVAGGGLHSLALTSTGAVYAWGYNALGALGNGTTTDSSTPVPVTGLSGVNVTAVAAGQYHSLALTSTGAVYAWGYDAFGQLGDGTNTSDSLTALLVSFPANGSATVVSISAGQDSSFALESDGSLWAWGDNSDGQYGNGTTTTSLTPIEVYTPTGGYRISGFAEGGYHSLAIVTPVPEPSSLLLVGTAIATAVGICRRRALAGALAGGIPHYQ